MENLVLYNIDATAGGCFRSAVRDGMRFEMAAGPRRDPPSGRHVACSYQYRLISPGSNLSHWRPVRRLAGFTGADLGRFPSAKRLEQVWLAIHHAEAQATGQPAATDELKKDLVQVHERYIAGLRKVNHCVQQRVSPARPPSPNVRIPESRDLP